MRVLVVSPPRSGNHWIECLLSTIHELTNVSGSKKPGAASIRAVRDWAQASGFHNSQIMHMHRRFGAKFCTAIDTEPAHLFTIARDPYDAFVSWYCQSQQRAPTDREKVERRPRQRIVCKLLDDPEVLTFLADRQRFGGHFASTNTWPHSGRAIPVRYEELHHNPIAALTRVTNQIAPVEPGRIEAAIEWCRAENMRQRSAMMAWNVRAVKVGDSWERLTETHLAIFREHYADLIRSLGYEVR